jgi:hypothetical protein
MAGPVVTAGGTDPGRAEVSFASPFLYWVGLDLDLDLDDRRQVAEFHAFYEDVHSREVVASNEDFLGASRFELDRADLRGVPGARFVAVYEVGSERGVERYLDRNLLTCGDRPRYSIGPESWELHRRSRCRTIWRQIASHGAPSAATRSIYVVGIDPPAGLTEEELTEFDDFYSNVHIVEVVRKRGFHRATRYGCEHAILVPPEGTPRSLAVYESIDPEDRQRHETLWRHVYRRV